MCLAWLGLNEAKASIGPVKSEVGKRVSPLRCSQVREQLRSK
jgi:hypothetical protein